MAEQVTHADLDRLTFRRAYLAHVFLDAKEAIAADERARADAGRR